MTKEVSVEPLAIAKAVRVAVEAIDGVVVTRGRFAFIGTYGPGEVVPGVVVSRERNQLTLDIHVIAAPSWSLPELAKEVRRVARQVVEQFGVGPISRCDVTIEDLQEM